MGNIKQTCWCWLQELSQFILCAVCCWYFRSIICINAHCMHMDINIHRSELLLSGWMIRMILRQFFFWRAIWLSWEWIFNDWNRYYWIRKFRNAKKRRTFYKVLTYIFNELLSKCLTLEGLSLWLDCEKDENLFISYWEIIEWDRHG